MSLFNYYPRGNELVVQNSHIQPSVTRGIGRGTGPTLGVSPATIARKTTRFGAVGLVLIALGAVSLVSCAPSPAEQARAAALSASQARLQVVLGELSASPTPAGLEAALKIQAMETESLEAALALGQQYPALVQGSAMAQVYLAIAACKMAGKADKNEDKIGWLRKGIRSFDLIHRQWPDNEQVFTFQVLTYSYFPPEAGAREDCLDLIDTMLGLYAAGTWTMADDQADRLWQVYQNLVTNYPDGDKKAQILDHARRAAAAFPQLAARPLAQDVLHG